MKTAIYKLLERLADVLKRKNENHHHYVNSDSLDRDRLEHFLRSGRYLGGISR